MRSYQRLACRGSNCIVWETLLCLLFFLLLILFIHSCYSFVSYFWIFIPLLHIHTAVTLIAVTFDYSNEAYARGLLAVLVVPLMCCLENAYSFLCAHVQPIAVDWCALCFGQSHMISASFWCLLFFYAPRCCLSHVLYALFFLWLFICL